MPIEFHCPECYAQIITPDETAGKQGRCSNCTAVVSIPLRNPRDAGIVRPPDSVSNAPARPSTSRRTPTPASGDPFKPTGDKTASLRENLMDKQFGFDQWEQKAEDGTWGEDNELSLKMRKMIAKERLLNRITGPAQALLVTATVNLIAVALSILAMIVYIIYKGAQIEEVNPTILSVWAVLTAVVMLDSMMIAIGGNHMKMTRSYSMAYTGAVFALLPLNALFFLTIPFGAWALKVLNDVNIAEGFKRR